MAESNNVVGDATVIAAQAADDSSHLEEQKVLKFKIKWDSYEATKGSTHLLKMLNADQAAFKIKAVIEGHLSILQAAMDALSVPDEKPVQFILTLFYNICRTDSSCFNIFDEGMQAKIDVFKPLMGVLKRPGFSSYTADKAAWLLTALMAHYPRYFQEDRVKEVLFCIQCAVVKDQAACTKYGALDATCNLLKADEYRAQVAGPDILDLIFSDSQSPSFLYKCVFCVWMLSYDAKITEDLQQNRAVIKWLKEILTNCRVEKVVRSSLLVLKSFMSNKAMCEQMVEDNIRDVVEQLESAKWRDSDLYDEIREACRLLSIETSALSSFDRYEKELQSGSLSWGFIHSQDFWKENVRQFEQNNGRAIRQLTALLCSNDVDSTTLAVACHDIGEFVSLHPLGKKLLNQFQVKPVKERVMQLMGQSDAEGKVDSEEKEVRREALLCCQKLMLNNWQGVGGK
jgi:V-type H+-transporting ATPase subunit H